MYSVQSGLRALILVASQYSTKYKKLGALKMYKNCVRLNSCLVALILLSGVQAFGQAGLGVAVGGALSSTSNLTVGQANQPAFILFTNGNANGLAEAVSGITINPSCMQQPAAGVACPGQGDLGVFSLSSNGTGANGCTGTTFTFAAPDANGTIIITPGFILPAGSGSTCRINFTLNVLNLPTADCNSPPKDGLQTCTGVTAGAADTAGSLAFGTGEGQPTFPPTLPCPAGSFTFYLTPNGDLNIVFDQFPAPNDNSYGVNAVGWPNGHKFGDLVGSDHAGFQLRDPSGTVRLSFNIDYLSANTSTPSGYASLGPFGGDGKILVGSLTPTDITFDTSLARNLNGTNISGLFNAAHVQQFGSVNVLVDSPPTDPTHLTYANSDPALQGWDFHDTYFVTIKAAKLAAIGFNLATWTVERNADALHNSPAKPCPPSTGGLTLTVTKKEVKDKQVKITIDNTGTVDEIITALQLTWPISNGNLTQIKLDGDVVYDSPDISPPSVSLTTGQLVADPHKRTITHNSSDVLILIFQNNADTNLSNYSGSVSTSGFSLPILP
jgi:hypothetical protein